MTNQWHNPRITKKPFNRYNPSLKNELASVYRPWFVVVALLCIFIGIAIIGCSVAMKSYDGDLKDSLFHLWVGIPLLCAGFFAVVPFVTKTKKTVIAFLVIIIIVMVICSAGALMGGLRYWMDHWQLAKRALDNNKCVKNTRTSKCVCSSGVFTMPASLSSCDDLETMVNLLIAEIALCSAGFLAAMMGIYLSFMAVCCAPWMYVEWYDEQCDPDFKKSGPPPVRNIGQTNVGYGNNY